MGGGGEGVKDTEGEGKWKTQKIIDNGGVGFSLDVILAMEPKFGSVSDQGWNINMSQSFHTAQASGHPNNNNNNNNNENKTKIMNGYKGVLKQIRFFTKDTTKCVIQKWKFIVCVRYI